jgi:FtsP/CotA-like multicopper oxidase with cupredoxin domain
VIRSWRASRVLLILMLAAIVMLPESAARRPVAQSVRVRDYYVAAEEVMWDFAPARRNLVMDHGGHGGALPATWAKNTRWKKVRYVEYTDDSFTTRRPQPEWLGILGPILRAEVGDTVRVHFLNRTRGEYGMHPHGLRYTKDHEGALYAPAGRGARVPPGGRFTYEWIATRVAAPVRRTRRRSSGGITRTSTKRPRPTPACWARSWSARKARHETTPPRPTSTVRSSCRS